MIMGIYIIPLMTQLEKTNDKKYFSFIRDFNYNKVYDKFSSDTNFNKISK